MNTTTTMNSRALVPITATLENEGGLGLDHWANPGAHCPCALVLDVSSSMAGAPIAELERALKTLLTEIAADDLAALRIDMTVFTAGGTVTNIVPFGATHVGMAAEPPPLVARGTTPLGAACRAAVQAIDARRSEYKACSVAAYRPFFFIFSDGAPNDEGWQHAAEELRGRAQRGWTVHCMGIGDADLATLQQFCVLPARIYQATQLRELFVWIGDSLKVVSRSHPTDSNVAGLPSVLPPLPKL